MKERFDPAANPSNVPKYVAISYIWGLKDNSSEVRICEPIRWSASDDIAMRYLRSFDRSRTRWIDAICINQAASSEKGPQVATAC